MNEIVYVKFAFLFFVYKPYVPLRKCFKNVENVCKYVAMSILVQICKVVYSF